MKETEINEAMEENKGVLQFIYVWANGLGPESTPPANKLHLTWLKEIVKCLLEIIHKDAILLYIYFFFYKIQYTINF